MAPRATKSRPSTVTHDVTYDVRVWKARKVSGARGNAYQVRWGVANGQRSRTFKTSALAESFRAELRASANRGEAFDLETGLPVSMLPSRADATWWEFTLTYVDLKWPALAPSSRRSMAEALVDATMALLTVTKARPPAADLRRLMTHWAFNSRRRAIGPPPEHLVGAAAWLERHTVPLVSLGNASNARALLDAIARTKNGRLAAATTIARKRAVIYNALELAVEHEHLPANPLSQIHWKAPKVRDSFDPRAVINPQQARELLSAVGNLDVDAYRSAVRRTARSSGGRTAPDDAALSPPRRITGLDVRGRHLVAFFACMYYSALRPSEAVALRSEDLDLPADGAGGDGWGWLLLSSGDPEVSGAWSDSGWRSARQLKHRAEDTVRPVPAPPPLVALLRQHLAEHGTAPDGRLFRGAYGARVSTESYTQVWDAARRQVFTPSAYASRLARRPYDLRHTAVSTWLAAGRRLDADRRVGRALGRCPAPGLRPHAQRPREHGQGQGRGGPGAATGLVNLSEVTRKATGGSRYRTPRQGPLQGPFSTSSAQRRRLPEPGDGTRGCRAGTVGAFGGLDPVPQRRRVQVQLDADMPPRPELGLPGLLELVPVHPHRPSPGLLVELPRCWHAASLPAGSAPPGDPGFMSISGAPNGRQCTQVPDH